MEKMNEEKSHKEDSEDFIGDLFTKIEENFKNPSLEKFKEDSKELFKKFKEEWNKSFINVSFSSSVIVIIIFICLLWGVDSLNKDDYNEKTNTTNWEYNSVKKVLNTLQPYKIYSNGRFIFHYKNISETEIVNLKNYFESISSEEEKEKNIEFIIDRIDDKIYIKAVVIKDINFIDEWLLLSMIRGISSEVFNNNEVVLKLYKGKFVEENLVKVIRTQ